MGLLEYCRPTKWACVVSGTGAVLAVCLLHSASAEQASSGVSCDAREWRDLTFAAGGHSIRSERHRFTHADVGKLFAGSYESGGDPGATRTIISVDAARGIATLSGRGFSDSRSGNGAALIGSDDADALQHAVDVDSADPDGRANVVRLPPGQCLLSRTIHVADTHGFRLEGAGRGLTTLLMTTSASALAILEMAGRHGQDEDGAAAVLSGFSIIKLPRANGGVRFAGTAVYVGNPNHSPNLTETGHTAISAIAVRAGGVDDGWSVGFEGENLQNAYWSDLQVNNPGGRPLPSDIPMPSARAEEPPPKWDGTAATGNGTSYYWHGSHGGYGTDSTFLGLVSVGGESAFDFRNVQGVHIIAAHFIASAFGIREIAPDPGAIDELFSLHDSLVQARYRDLTLVGSTDNEISGNLFWGYGNPKAANPSSWIGFWLTGFSQSTTFNDNVLVDADANGWGVYDCMLPFAHTIDGNSFQYLRHGITTCPGEGNGAITGNVFAGMSVSSDIENQGRNVIVGNNRSDANATNGNVR